MRTKLGLAAATGLLLLLAVASPASATIVFQAGHQQYTNVNIAADTNALSIVGDIGNTGVQMTFNTMIGPNGSTQVEMHGQNGVAFIESFADSLTNNHTGFSSLTLTPQAGFGFTAGDFSLDQLDSLTNPTEKVTLSGLDQFGNKTATTLAIDLHGQNTYNFTTSGGEIVKDIIITVPTSDLLVDLKHLSVQVTRIAIPEPSALALFAGGLGLIALAAYRPWKRVTRRS